MVSHDLAKFHGYWASASGDIKYVICQVTSQNHVIERSCNFISRNFSWCFTTLSSLVAIDSVVVAI